MAALEDSKAEVETTENIHPTISASLDEKMRGMSLTGFAKDGAQIEHQLSAKEALKAYPRAIFWSLLVSTCVIMEGFDTNLLSNFYAYPQFKKKYGDPAINYELSAEWQAGLGNISGVGAFFGALLNGYLVHRFGHRKVLIGALIILTGFIATSFSAPNLTVLLIGQFFSGFPWGIFATAAPAYASEVLPMSLRVYLTSYTNMCFIIGQFISSGVLAGLVNVDSEWAFRIPFACQWIWPAFLVPTLWFMPDSPWHLVRHGRLDEAEVVLRKLQSPTCTINVKHTLAAIVHTNELEEELKVGTSYLECFKGTELRRTEISCMVFAGQIWTGLYFAYASTYFFTQVGVSTDITYKLAFGGTAIALVSTLISWFVIMPRVGRRKTYIIGTFTMFVLLFIIGFLGIAKNNTSAGITQSSLCLVWTMVFQFSVGQLGWALPAEMGSTRLRQKTIVLARNAYYVTSVIAGVLSPYFINPSAWNLKGYTGFVWGSTAFLTGVWAYFRLPETKDRSFEELDLLFAKRVSARKFQSYQIDAFDEKQRFDAVATRFGSTAPTSNTAVAHVV